MKSHILIILLGLLLSLAAVAQEKKLKSALVIIDMQPFFVTRDGNDKDPENIKKVKSLLEQQKFLIDWAKVSHTPIVVIEYKESGKTNKELMKPIEGYSDYRVIEKDSDGMFDDENTKKELHKFLKEHDVKNLIITGANGGACVEKSIRGSLKNGYSISVVPEAVADFNYTEFIYPYKDQYIESKFTLCEGCHFNQVQNFEAASLMRINMPTNEAAINDSDRNHVDDAKSLLLPPEVYESPSAQNQ